MSEIISIILVLLGFGLPSVFFIIADQIIPAIILIIIGFVWLATPWKNRGWFTGFALVCGVLANALGTWIQFPPFVMITSTISLLSVWDLEHFRKLVAKAEKNDNIQQIERKHLFYLLLFQIIGYFIFFSAISIQLKPTYLQAIALVFLTFVGIMQLIRWLVKILKT
jgi:hypothetical protein